MEIKYFRLIKTIAEEGNIVNSSEKLFLTQSALSHQLIVIEERLGFKVFHRSRNKWKLTKEGEELYKLANTVLNSIDEGFKSITNIKEGSKGIIRICTECSNFYQGFPAFMQKMGYLYPDIDIQLREATNKSLEKLRNDEVDMAIVTSEPFADDLTSIRIYEGEVMAILNQEHPLAHKDYLKAVDFLDLNLIIQAGPLSTVTVYEQFLKPNEIEPAKVHIGVYTEICLQMIAANMGVMCMPKWVLDPFIIPNNLVFKKIGENGLIRRRYLVFRKCDRSKKYIEDFVSNFTEDFSLDQ